MSFLYSPAFTPENLWQPEGRAQRDAFSHPIPQEVQEAQEAQDRFAVEPAETLVIGLKSQNIYKKYKMYKKHTMYTQLGTRGLKPANLSRNVLVTL